MSLKHVIVPVELLDEIRQEQLTNDVAGHPLGSLDALDILQEEQEKDPVVKILSDIYTTLKWKGSSYYHEPVDYARLDCLYHIVELKAVRAKERIDPKLKIDEIRDGIIYNILLWRRLIKEGIVPEDPEPPVL